MCHCFLWFGFCGVCRPKIFLILKYGYEIEAVLHEFQVSFFFDVLWECQLHLPFGDGQPGFTTWMPGGNMIEKDTIILCPILFDLFWGRVTRNISKSSTNRSICHKALERASREIFSWDKQSLDSVWHFPWRCILAYSLRLHLYSTILSKLGCWSTGPDFQGEASGLRWEQSNSFGQQMHGLPSKEGQQMLFSQQFCGAYWWV